MDTITLQEALAGFTANESAALGSYIGLSSGGAGQKQSIAALAKVAGEQYTEQHNGYIAPDGGSVQLPRGVYLFGQAYYGFGLASFGQSTIDDHTGVQTKLNISFERVSSATIKVTNNRGNNVYTYYKLLWHLS